MGSGEKKATMTAVAAPSAVATPRCLVVRIVSAETVASITGGEVARVTNQTLIIDVNNSHKQ